MNIFSRQSGLLAIALLLVSSLIAANLKQYDYVIVAQKSFDNKVVVTTGTTKFEEMKFKLADIRSDFNFTPALQKVEELEAQGYELVTNNAQVQGNYPFNYFLPRRPK